MPSLNRFPGMDPYLEHPVLWPGVHLSLIAAIRRQLSPRLRPRYAVSAEERIYLEHREWYLEILDLYREQQVVTAIEVISPSNKRPGPGRDAYVRKQQATLSSDVHLVEIDLLRTGPHVLAGPAFDPGRRPPTGYLVNVNRHPQRGRFELYPWRLPDRLPRFGIPLTAPDSDVFLDLQQALDDVYEDGSYMIRVKYDEPCVPPLPPDDQAWATALWQQYQAAHPEWFGSANNAAEAATTD